MTETALKAGFKVKAYDRVKYSQLSTTKNLENIQPGHLPWVPDVVWISFPCPTYSVRGFTHHRDGIRPKSLKAVASDQLVCHVLAFLSELQVLNPELIFYMENPRGMLRKMPFMEGYTRVTVTYCQYGMPFQKPTDIWTNNLLWEPRPPCERGSPCHEAAPRSEYLTGLQALPTAYERSILPLELCEEVVSASLEHLITLKYSA